MGYIDPREHNVNPLAWSDIIPKIAYIEKSFRAASLKKIEQANDIIDEYSAQGFSLTLRQLYYQFVARDLLPNNQKEYDKLGSLISNGRVAGLINWYSIEDRTRSVVEPFHWEDIPAIIESSVSSFSVDFWERQECRPEVWIEKQALAGVIEGVCGEYDVPHFACRGYVSQSTMWRAGQRLQAHKEAGKTPIVFHLGDHDPSGIDMTRDNYDRIALFAETMGIEVRRIALNFDQIEEYKPPPNPAKQDDSRFESYVENFGDSCWELDALQPSVIVALIKDNIKALIDDDAWEKAEAEQEAGRDKLRKFVDMARDEGMTE